jgi:hypothetical protein
MLYIVSAIVFLATPLLLLVLAQRDEYLLVLTWSAHGTMVFERRQGERYKLISPLRIPLALARYATLRTAEIVAWGWQRVRQLRPAKVAHPASPW